MVVHPSRDNEPGVHPRTSPSATAIDAPSIDLTRIHVLAVDDEPDALALVTEVLQTAGARVTAATSGADAIRALDIETPDVLVTDLGMPGFDGFALIDRVRRHADERVREIPAAALTAFRGCGTRRWRP
jgi:CheY-like chemotaxis protein